MKDEFKNELTRRLFEERDARAEALTGDIAFLEENLAAIQSTLRNKKAQLRRLKLWNPAVDRTQSTIEECLGADKAKPLKLVLVKNDE